MINKRKSLKLPSLRSRNSNSKPNWDSVGAIKFFTDRDEDVCGLDEAMHGLSESAKCSTEPVSESLENSALQSHNSGSFVAVNEDPLASTSGTTVEAIDDDANSDFEVAVDAASTSEVNDSPSSLDCYSKFGNYTGDDTDQSNHPVSNISSRVNMMDADISYVGPGQSYLSDVQNDVGLDWKSSSVPVLDYLNSTHPLSNSPISKVGAEDIHALLDSYPSVNTKHSEKSAKSVDRNPSICSNEMESSELIYSIKSTKCSDDSSIILNECNTTISSNKEQNQQTGHFVCLPGITDCGSNAKYDELNSTGSNNAVKFTPVKKSDTKVKSKQLSSKKVSDQQKQPRTIGSKNETTPTHRSSWLTFKILIPICVVLFAMLIVHIWSMGAFVYGLLIGSTCTAIMVFLYNFLNTTSVESNSILCPISGLPLGQSCCSFHYRLDLVGGSATVAAQWWPIFGPVVPDLPKKIMQLRDLPSLPIPNIADENIRKSMGETSPLGQNLGVKLDQNNRPIYKGWFNEISQYDQETYRIGRTFSVFITLNGTQLRLQRPERNISRRSLWNDEVMPASLVKFKSQRVFDLLHARIILLPPGLVTKRWWSKKYPICIQIPVQSKSKVNVDSMISTAIPNSTSFQHSILIEDQKINEHFTTEKRNQSNSFDQCFSEDSSSVLTSNSTNNLQILYLFCRTSREKETWYRRFQAAALGVPLIWTPQKVIQEHLLSTEPIPNLNTDEAGRSEANTNADLSSQANSNESLTVGGGPINREPIYVTYIRHMAKFMPADWLVRGVQAMKLNVNQISCESNLMWLNAVIGRLFWDLLREVYWLNRIRSKIEAKLKKIHLPNFIDELAIVDIDLGAELPVIRRIATPYLDENGLWFEVDVAYSGGFTIAMETSVNLLRWNQKSRENPTIIQDNVIPNPVSVPDFNKGFNLRSTTKTAAFHSDEEDSVDSTTDSENDDKSPETVGNVSRASINGGRSTNPSLVTSTSPSGDLEPVPTEDNLLQLPSGMQSRRRFMRLMNRITQSPYFQKAVDTRIVQRGMERLSNTRLALQIEVQLLSGKLMINIPPPPTDRIWYGFMPVPQLHLKTRPRVGEKVFTMPRILEFIEKKIIQEFQEVVVMPNMDDIKIPLLISDT